MVRQSTVFQRCSLDGCPIVSASTSNKRSATANKPQNIVFLLRPDTRHTGRFKLSLGKNIWPNQRGRGLTKFTCKYIFHQKLSPDNFIKWKIYLKIFLPHQTRVSKMAKTRKKKTGRKIYSRQKSAPTKSSTSRPFIRWKFVFPTRIDKT